MAQAGKTVHHCGTCEQLGQSWTGRKSYVLFCRLSNIVRYPNTKACEHYHMHHARKGARWHTPPETARKGS